MAVKKYDNEYKTRKKYEVTRVVKRLLLEGVKFPDILITKEANYYVIKWDNPKTTYSAIPSLKEMSAKLKLITKGSNAQEGEQQIKAHLNKFTKAELERWAQNEIVFFLPAPQPTLSKQWESTNQSYSTKAELVNLIYLAVLGGTSFL